MEDFFLATFLFLVYFSFFCWLITPDTQVSRSVTEDSNPALSLSVLRDTFSVEPDPDEEAEAQKVQVATQEPSLEELLKGVELDTLQLRPARKVASRLGIKQKVRGKDQPLSWLRAQIKKRLEEEPQNVVPVIYEVLGVA
ncbi:hypothetical protein IQ249_15010 [Lusitaniella coriacea LEGE 07157]|uniref:Uncharacterized protein n=1 Tax=Lusitaniella coriacea LEGE 07157 TaxID=945747 RepID=A0A8J7IVE7_9CYAN|nr:hypothetical protein [Lusitaniella coriacea]MBE9117208.1 hypothetical protein [Lusitaniella coriacea LEGE 07157]